MIVNGITCARSESGGFYSHVLTCVVRYLGGFDEVSLSRGLRRQLLKGMAIAILRQKLEDELC